MYSVILLAAMTSPADAPAFGRIKGGCAGSCAGCTGSACAGCVGTACSGCAGSACAGCAGFAHGVPVHAYAMYPGAGWAGYSCGGCCGGHFLGFKSGCWGTGGYRTFNSCHGSGACFGYAYAGVNYGFAGCYGSCYGSYTNYFSYWPVPAPPPAGFANSVQAQTKSAPAAVIVTLPADAKLFANGQATKQTSGERRFTTPELQPGRSYRYTMSAEIVRNDQPITETIEVDVRPGAESRVTFGKLIAATPTEPTRVASK